jgi:hypothetical protein
LGVGRRGRGGTFAAKTALTPTLRGSVHACVCGGACEGGGMARRGEVRQEGEGRHEEAGGEGRHVRRQGPP